MTHTHQSHTSADGLFAYGLTGIELGHVTNRRDAERQRDRIAAAARAASPVEGIRQRLGEAMVRLGTGLAGEAAKTPRVGAGITPKAGTL
jgi:hypothetical protein